MQPSRAALLSKSSGGGRNLRPKEKNGARSSNEQTGGGSEKRSKRRPQPQSVGRRGGKQHAVARREQEVVDTRPLCRLPQEVVEAALMTHELPAAQLVNRPISSREDTGINPSIILHITEKPNRYSDFDDLYQCFGNTAGF